MLISLGKTGAGRVPFLRLIWISLLLVSAAAAQDPTQVGQWTATSDWPFAAVHTHVLPTGKVLFWPAFDLGDNPTLWDPATGSFTPVPMAGWNIFCAGHAFLPNGQLLVAGGHVALNYGLPNAVIYDPVANTWIQQPNMNAGRWYPTNTTLANGDVLVVSGQITPTGGNDLLPQVYQTATGTWRDLTSANLYLPLYPMMFQAPNGKVFSAGPQQATRYLDTTGTGAWSGVGNSNFGLRDYGTAVTYDVGKILLVGGANPPTATAEIIDLNTAPSRWQYSASMKTARRQANATILPDGRVLVTGGSSGAGFDNYSAPVRTAEVWDPATGHWNTWATAPNTYRGYHSTAVLLPDGRVLSAGGSKASGEIFSPPYLFAPSRPTITTAPTAVTFGQTFFVATPDGANVSQVSWIRLPATTHAFNQNQRINFLTFTQTDGGLNVTAPTDGNHAPPGHYMLFLLDQNKTPSVAAIIRLDSSIQSAPAAPTNLTAAAVSGGQVNLSWTNPANNQTGFLIERSPDGANFSQIASTIGATTTYSDTGLAATTTHSYRVRAYNADARSDYSNVASATTTTGNPVSLTPASLNFGSQLVPGPSQALAVTLTNQQAADMNIVSIAASTEFAQTNDCPTPLPAGGSCTISVTFAPQSTGPKVGAITIADDAPNSPQTISLTGNGILAVSFSPTSLSFGNQVLLTSSISKKVVVKNNQDRPLSTIVVSAAPGDFTQTNNCPSSLVPGGSCNVFVTFTPQATGSRIGTLTVTDDAPGSVQTVPLTGFGVAPVVITPIAFSYGGVPVGTPSTPKDFFLTNKQTVPLTITSITASGDYAQTNTCGSSVAPGAQCTITAIFTPTAKGKRTGTVVISDSSVTSPHIITLQGSGT